MNPKVLLVGGGLSGSLLWKYITQAKSFTVSVWEASPRIAGRMASQSHPGYRTNVFGDLGAQYLTIQSTPSPFQSIYDELVEASILLPLRNLIEGARPSHSSQTHFIAWKGMSTVVEWNFKNADIFVERELYRLDLSECKSHWLASYRVTDSEVITEKYQGVCLTIPPSRIFRIEGNWLGVLTSVEGGENVISRLRTVRFSQRFAMVAFYSAECRQEILKEFSWLAKYIDDDKYIRYISIESRKAAHGCETKPDDIECILVHSTIHLDCDVATAQDKLLSALETRMPILQKYKPTHVQTIHWEESQTIKEVGKDLPLYANEYSWLGKMPNGVWISLSGDAFTESNFEGCLKSANDAATAIRQLYSISDEK